MSRIILFTFGCLAGLSGCGLKGDLYLPKNDSPVVITAPVGAAQQSSSSSSVNSSAGAQP